MNLKELFRCPKCKGKLEQSDSSYNCNNCQIHYPIHNDVPVFMTGDLETDTYSEFWDKGWENRYEHGDHTFHKESEEQYRWAVREKLEISEKQKTPITSAMPVNDKIVLNIGCGMDEASLFAGIGANNYIGIDYSYNAAKYSFESIKKLGRAGITAQANAELLPIESASIDLVYSSGVLHHTPNTEATFNEVFRVLKPHGKAVIGLYSTYSPTFITARIVNTIKSLTNRSGRQWFELTETAWGTEGSFNPWTKTYTRGELKKMFYRFGCSNFKIRSTGFLWGNVLPIIGKHLEQTTIGKKTAAYFSNKLGSMWVITFEKK